MLITYRRTGGLFALLTLVAVVLAATVVTVALAATLFIVGAAVAAAALLVRAVLPRSWRTRRSAPATPWPHETIDATAVNAEERRLPDERVP